MRYAIIKALRALDDRNPYGFFTLDSGSWASWLMSQLRGCACVEEDCPFV